MTFWILPILCKVLARSTAFLLMEDETNDPLVKAKMLDLNRAVKEKIGDSVKDDMMITGTTYRRMQQMRSRRPITSRLRRTTSI